MIIRETKVSHGVRGSLFKNALKSSKNWIVLFLIHNIPQKIKKVNLYFPLRIFVINLVQFFYNIFFVNSKYAIKNYTLYHIKHKLNKKNLSIIINWHLLKKEYIKTYVEEISLPFVSDVGLGAMLLVKVEGFFHFFIKLP